MTRAMVLALAASTVVLAQQPQIQNGAVETRKAASLDREISAIAAASTEATWVGWREPAVNGMGSSCCWNSWDNEPMQRGCTVEPSVPNTNGWAGMNQPAPPTKFPAPSGPARLEAGTDVLIMLRLVDKSVERIRTYSDDCPLDAGGRKVIWLDGVATDASVKYLASLVHLKDVPGVPTDLRRRINSGAISAIGQHQSGNIDELIAFARQSDDSSSRSSAFTWLGRSKDPRAMQFIEGLLK